MNSGDSEQLDFVDSSIPYRPSSFWDFWAPIIVSAFPACAVYLLRLMIGDFEPPMEQVSRFPIVAIAVVYHIGLIAMAALILVSYEFCKRQLADRTHGRSPFWRRWILKFAFASLLMFDVCNNLGIFLGDGLLSLSGIPFFLAYVAFVRIAFSPLRRWRSKG